MKKLIIIAFLVTLSFSANCSKSYGLSGGERIYCEKSAQGAGEGVALSKLMDGVTRGSMTNEQIYNYCNKERGYSFQSFKDIFMYSCASKLGYRFK